MGTGRLEALVARLEASEPALAEALSRTRAFVESWWTTPYLTWFTDHGPDHSDRVANNCLEIIETVGLTDSCTDVELFAVTAAALLHDVGMQVLISREAALGNMTDLDYDQVRKRHPQESLRTILEKGAEAGLPDDPELLPAVALLAQAHGSDYFEESVKKLKGYEKVRNESFRGPGFAAILLMADELDLHYERANFPDPAQAQLTNVSRAHNFKHLYVSSVDLVEKPPSQVRASLSLTFPEAVSAPERETIKRWMVQKLRQQIGFVQPTLRSAFATRLQFNRRIDATNKTETIPYRDAIDREAMRFIRQAVTRSDIVNYTTEIATIDRIVDDKRVICIKSADGSMENTEDVLSWLRERLGDHTVASSWSIRNKKGGTASDILAEWLEALGSVPADGGLNEKIVREDLLEALCDLASETSPVAFFASAVDFLPEHDKRWFLETCLPRLLGSSEAVKVLVSASGETELHLPQEAFVVALGSPSPQEVERHFEQFNDESLGGLYTEVGLNYDLLRALTGKLELRLLEDQS